MLKQTAKRGFTITELIIVIVVIAILAAVLIPTFANLIKKANLSADQQAVRQMNTILTAEETVSGKPATVAQAKEILVANGISDFDPMEAANTFYWVGSENRVLLWTKDDGADTGKVVYPKEMQKKYKDLTEPSNDWANLSVAVNMLQIEVEEGETLRKALLDEVVAAEDGAILQLPKGETVDLGAGGLYFLGNYMKNDGGTGKTLTIDLNGGTITSNTPYSNGYYYGCTVPTSGSLTLVNGKVDADGDINVFQVESGAHLIMRNVELSTPNEGANAIYPCGDASEVVLESCKIVTSGSYAIATNNQVSDNIHIKVYNTTLQAASCALLVNVPCDVWVEDSTIIGGGWGMLVRSGHAVIENTTIKTTDGDTGANDSRTNTSCEYFAYNSSASNLPYWGSGAQVPYAPLIVGDYSSHNAYNHDTEVTLTNVKLENANSAKVPDVVIAARPEGKDVVLTYDAATTVGRLVVYGEGYVRTDVSGTAINHIFKHKGTITVNGTAKTYNGTVGNPDGYVLVEYGSADRYTIPTSVGSFPGYQWFDISVLQGAELDAFKAHFTSKGLNLTEAQWATVKFAAGGNANVIKSIKYME